MKQFIYDSDLYMPICEFLDICSLKKFALVNKEYYYNTKHKIIRNYIFKNIHFNIIIRFMKKICLLKKRIELLNNYDRIKTPHKMALFYFFYYSNLYISNYFNINVEWKKNIIDKYNTANLIKNNYNKFDLFYLLKKMTIEEINLVGW